MRFLTLLMILSVPALGEEIKGSVFNGTTQKPGKVENLQLILLENNMTVLTTLNEVEGEFTMTTDQPIDGKQLLLQANKDGVLYSQAFSWPASKEDVKLTIYESSHEGDLQTSIGSLALYAYGQTLDIGVFYNIENNSPHTVQGEDGSSFTFDLIQGHTHLEASTKRGTLPLRQQLKIEGDKATLQYALKPGPTQLMVRSQHSYNPNDQNHITIKLPNAQKLMKLLVLPHTLKVEGEQIEFISNSDAEKMSLYEISPNPEQTELHLKVSGKPLDKPLTNDAGSSASSNNTANTSHDGANTHNAKIEGRPHMLDQYKIHIIASVIALFGIFSFFGLKQS